MPRPRWRLPAAARRLVRPRPPLALPAQPAVHAGRLGPGAPWCASMEPRADRRGCSRRPASSRSATRRSTATSGPTSGAGGTLHTHLRGAPKQCRKRYGRYDSRGRLAGKRPITARPAAVEQRREGRALGGGHHARHGGPALRAEPGRAEDRLSGARASSRRAPRPPNHAARHPAHSAAQPQPVRTITADNGTEFHGYARIERADRHAPSTSRRPTTPGSAAPTRTPTAWSASTSRKARAWRTSPSTTARGSPARSTTAPASGSAIARRRNAMHDEPQCCTSKLISRHRSG